MAEWLPFRTVETVTLDGFGAGSITFGPTFGEWLVEQVSASVSSNALEPEFTTYINNAFIGGSYSGSRTNDTTFNQRLNAQEKLRGVWVGGDPGATATMVLSGRKLV